MQEIAGDLEPEQVLINLMALVLFPFIGKPILQILFEMDEDAFDAFIEDRLSYLPELVVKMTFKSQDFGKPS